MIGFNALFADRLDQDLDSLLRGRATAGATGVIVTPSGSLRVHDPQGDPALDAGLWVFSGQTLIDGPASTADEQQAVAALARRGSGYAATPGDIRLYALPIRHAGRQVGTVIASASTTSYGRARTAAIEGSALVAVLMLLGAYPVFRIAAGRALRPVDEMAHQAAEWSAHALTERFGSAQRYRETQTLAATLDEVLDRLAAIVRHERQLSAELSHELRTPLSTIVAETDLLLGRPHTRAELEAAHHAIRDSALTMERILETLLSAARVDIQNAPGRCEIRPVIEHLADTRRDPAPRVTVDAPDGLGVGVDAPILERILAPILENAYRYADRQVIIRAHRPGDSVVIEIGDDGPGVPTDVREVVFEPGRRGSNGDDHDGAGLGLALARRLARAAAGDVSLESGSTFAIRLPPA